MKKKHLFLSIFLSISLVAAQVAIPDLDGNGNLAPRSSFAVSSSHDTGEESRIGVLLSSLVSLVASLLLLFTFGCVAADKEQIAHLTEEIRDRIRAGEPGNSYGIVDLIDDRRDLVEESGLSREELAGSGGLDLKGLAKEIFLEFGVIVEGARERDLLHIQDLLRILPPEHIQGFHGIVLRVHYDRFYDHNAGGRYYPWNEGIISFSPRLLAHGRGSVTTGPLAHEIGHFHHDVKIEFLEGLLFWYYHLFCSWEDEDYPKEYAQTNHWEEYAQIYEGWVLDTDSLISSTREHLLHDDPRSEVLMQKVLMVVRSFIFQKGNRYYIRVYKNMHFQDILLDIEEPSEFDLFHLYRLRRFMVPEMDNDSGRDFVDIDYHHPRAFVDRILSNEGYNANLVGRRIYRMIEKISQDQGLNEAEKRQRAVHLIYRFLNADPAKSADALQQLQSLRLHDGGTLIEFRPDELESLDELEALWFMEPQAVENWLFHDTARAVEKIRSLIPYFEDANFPRSWPVLFLAIYDKVMREENPNPRMLLPILTSYCENLTQIYSGLHEIIQLEAALLFRFLATWNPEFLRTYLGPEIRQEVIRQFADEMRLIRQEESLSDEERLRKTIEISDKIWGPLRLLTQGRYVSLEVAKLFRDNVGWAIELLVGEARPQNRDDLERIFTHGQRHWISYWQEEAFQPVLEELRSRFQGISLREMMERVGTREDGRESLDEETLLALFLILNGDLENFIRNHAEWFLNFANRSPIQLEGDSGVEMNEIHRQIMLIRKLKILFEVSPQAFELLWNQLTDEEVALVVHELFSESSVVWEATALTEFDLFPDDDLLEVRFLERILQLKGREILQGLIAQCKQRGVVVSFYETLIVYLKAGASHELSDILTSFFLEPEDCDEILTVDGERGLRKEIFRLMPILPAEELIRRLNAALPQTRYPKNHQEIIHRIIEELRTGHFEFAEPEDESSSEGEDQEEREKEILDQWRRSREYRDRERERETEDQSGSENGAQGESHSKGARIPLDCGILVDSSL